MELISLLFYMICAAVFGGGGACLIARFGARLNILDRANHRSSHTGAVPKGGGIGILFTFVIVAVQTGFSAAFWVPAVALSLISFMGDRVDLSVKLRLGVQFFCAVIVLGGFFASVGLTCFYLLPVMALFIVGTANIYNFMDGIDGIAGITAVNAFGLLGGYAYKIGAGEPYMVLALAMSVSSFAFLFFNLPKARVFMGDVGSVLLGFVFASMVVFLSGNIIDFFCMSGFLFLFYMDEITTMAVRYKNGESLTKAHRKHLYQLLANEMGVAHWKIAVGYGLFQWGIGLSVLFFRSHGMGLILLLYTVYTILFFIFSNSVRKKVLIQ